MFSSKSLRYTDFLNFSFCYNISKDILDWTFAMFLLESGFESESIL
jgi:hypothetical protein